MTQAAKRRWWTRDWFLAVTLVAVTLIAYHRVGRAGFIWDDDVLLTGNAHVQAADGLRGIWFSTSLPDYFPLTSTTFWLEWRLWGGNPLGYHLVNVLLHAFGAVLLWRVLARLKIPGAWLAAAIFALHPVNVESVAWISERKNVLAMVFYAFALLAYLRHEDADRRVGHACVPHNPDAVSPRASVPECASSSEWRWYAAALGAFVLGMLSKAAVAPMPLVLLGLAWWRRGRVERRDVWRCVPFFVVAAALSIVTLWFQHHRAISTDVVRTDGFGSRLAGAGWAVWFYLYKAILPLNLSFVYPRWRLDGNAALSYVPVLLLAVLLMACWYSRRRWGRVWLFGIGYFVVMLLPVLGFVDIYFMRYSLVADHWQYFSIIGPVALAAAGISTALGSCEKGRSFLKPAGCGILLAMSGLLTWRQTGMYDDVETLWRTTLAQNTNSFLAHNNLGEILFRKGRVDEALNHFLKGLEIEPGSAGAHNNIGNVLLETGRVDEAIRQFEIALDSEPDFFMAHYNLGTTLMGKDEVDQALPHFQEALRIKPTHAGAHNNFGNALLQKGRLNDAIAQYRMALEIRPDLPDAHVNLGHALLRKGRVDQAIHHFQSALKLLPGDAVAHNNLGNALLGTGRLNEAISHYQKALEIQPEYAKAHNNLGLTLLHMRRIDEAISHLRTAVKLQPDYANAHNNLARALLESGKADEALTHCLIALKLDPGDESTLSNLAEINACKSTDNAPDPEPRPAIE